MKPWLRNWLLGRDTGLSSRTIARTFTRSIPADDGWRPSAPHDEYDVGRCVRLLDLAEANGANWRANLHRVARRCKAWAPLVDTWPAIEAAYRHDLANDMKRPSKCRWVLANAQGHADPYAHIKPHPFAEDDR